MSIFSNLLQSVLRYIEMAHQCLTETTANNKQQYHNEVQWFMKISWNVALEADECYFEMMSAFDSCQKVIKC